MASVQRISLDGRLDHASWNNILDQWREIALVFAGTIITLGFAVLAGWQLNLPALTTIFRNASPMWPATAILLVLSGTALGLMSKPGWPRTLSTVPAMLVVVSTLAVLSSHITGNALGYENWLFAEGVASTGLPFAGRPAFMTSLGLLTLNTALLLMIAKKFVLAQQLASLGILSACVALTGYIFSVPDLYGSTAGGYVPINTAFAFLLLGLGIYAAQADAGVMRILTRDSLSRPTLIRLWLLSLVLTLLLGWGTTIAQSMSGASPAQMLALFVSGNAVIITVLIGWSAVVLQKMELERQNALERVLTSQDHLRNLQAITASLSNMSSVHDVAAVIAQQGRVALGAQAAIAALLNTDGNDDQALDIIHSIGYAPNVIAKWQRIPWAARTPMRDVITNKELLLIESREQAARIYPQLATEQALHQSWAVMPLIHDSQVVGAVDFAFEESRFFSLEDRSFLLSLAEQCAQAMTRAQLHESKQRAAWAAGFLASLSRVLTRRQTLDERVDALVHTIVPELADWCTVNLLEPAGTMRLAGVAHTDADQTAWIRAWAERHPMHAGNGARLRDVLNDHRVTLIERMDDESMRRVAGDDEDALRWLRESNTGSMVEVALDSHNKTFGILKLGRSNGSPPFTPADVPLIRDIAQQAAWALDNAQLFQSAMASSKVAERNAERTQRLQAVTALMNTAQTVQQATDAMVTQGIEALGARAGFITLFAEHDGRIDRNWLSIVAQRGYDTPGVEISPLPAGKFRVSVHTPANLAIQQGEPVWVETVEELFARFPAAARLLAQHDHAWACVPLIYEQNILGALALSFSEPRLFDDEDKAMFIALARQCAQALERARLLAAEQQLNTELKAALAQVVHDEQVQRLLARAGELLSAPLDMRQRLDSAAKLFVEQMADWCTIEIMDAQGSLSQQAVAHADARKQPALERLRSEFPPVTDSDVGISMVMRTGEPALYSVVDETVLTSMSRSAAHKNLLCELGMHSAMMLPLRANGKLLGSISFVRCDSAPAYTQSDLAITTDLAVRVGMALENARLFEETLALNQHLEMRVAERTTDLERSNDMLRQSREQLRALSRQTMSLVEKERAQVVREVHDELGQSLASVKMSLAMARRQLANGASPHAVDSITSAVELIDDTIKSIRNLAANLRPVVLDDLGLQAAIEWQVREFEHKTGIYCDFSSEVDAGVSFSQDISTAAFRIMQEALNNVVRHAQASEVWVTLVANASGMMLSIRDNGQGMNVAQHANTYGLLSMHERALQLNGQLDIQSAPNHGTAIVLTLPMQSEMQQ